VVPFFLRSFARPHKTPWGHGSLRPRVSFRWEVHTYDERPEKMFPAKCRVEELEFSGQAAEAKRNRVP
jgi:hypothetical protein